ncbi:MAG: PspC domain-containing protein [Candidatus Aenigmatarchaeota archaeon]|nr:MAG: PspC domain-containing protein [Candidatus Aenigmarchaeota archaeon]
MAIKGSKPHIRPAEVKVSRKPVARTKKLYRSGKDRILGGVCGGIAEYLGVDPVLIRLVWIAGSLAWGFGIILYIIMWIIMPRNPNHKWED